MSKISETEEGGSSLNLAHENEEKASNKEHFSGLKILLLGLYLMLVFLLLVFLLLQIWPKEIPLSNGSANEVMWDLKMKLPFFAPFELANEKRIIFIVLMSGSIGGMIHALQSFTGFVGSKTFVCSWLWWYLLRPLVGAGLALFFYLSLRGGLLSPQAEASDMSIFGFAAISALAGLFSEQATAKLKELFDTLFKTDDIRPDKLNREESTSNKNST